MSSVQHPKKEYFTVFVFYLVMATEPASRGTYLNRKKTVKQQWDWCVMSLIKRR